MFHQTEVPSPQPGRLWLYLIRCKHLNWLGWVLLPMWTPLLLLPWWLLKSLLVVFLMRMGWINYSRSELGHCSPCSRCLNVSVQTEKEDGLTRCHLSSHAASVAKNDHSIKQIQRHKDTHTACTTALCAVCFRWLTETVSQPIIQIEGGYCLLTLPQLYCIHHVSTIWIFNDTLKKGRGGRGMWEGVRLCGSRWSLNKWVSKDGT